MKQNNGTKFTVLDLDIPLLAILITFAIIGIIALVLFFVILFRKNRTYVFDKEQVNAKDFKRLEKFEQQRDDLELEIAKIKKLRKQAK
ncbi:TIGR04561 family membrane protein [Spiroplasma chinense]|uniref:TIGR04561 family membrane protein n=1 Tax=Spiroplasma chinense TaxID=216932 RepID=A0A5B9Y3Z6_9MOLU|nr:TIGR04561 family membrane protein [Spiroplasma chinense]QEH61680.1 TIGR04561 family membrane protein [Spiroplasma chinense]